MSTRLVLAATAVVAGAALATTALPALSAGSGNVIVAITAAAPAAPCVTVTPGSLDYGTLPFSSATVPSTAERSVLVASCATSSDQKVSVAATNATGSGGSVWILDERVNSACPGTDRYALTIGLGGVGPSGEIDLRTAAAFIPDALGNPGFRWGPGAFHGINVRALMPCQGSSGAGAAHTLSVLFTAIVS